MCTLSFLPEGRGFCFFMNRDEQRSRAVALPPCIYSCGIRQALYPSEPSGGTWIGVNDRGLALALINWYSRPQFQEVPAFSRGKIIPELLTVSSLKEAQELLSELPLKRLHPFRLIGISLEEKRVQEWHSDSLTLNCYEAPWERMHWFSSGYAEQEVSLARGKIAAQYFSTLSAASRERLQELHRSHEPERGSHSICMHREDAKTVSYTTLSVTTEDVLMSYLNGSPCEAAVSEERVMPLHIME